jgi:hypothetical protein
MCRQAKCGSGIDRPGATRHRSDGGMRVSEREAETVAWDGGSRGLQIAVLQHNNHCNQGTGSATCPAASWIICCTHLCMHRQTKQLGRPHLQPIHFLRHGGLHNQKRAYEAFFSKAMHNNGVECRTEAMSCPMQRARTRQRARVNKHIGDTNTQE